MEQQEIRDVCEAVMGCQRGMEEIEKYIGRLNDYVASLNAGLENAQVEDEYQRYGQRLETLQTQAEKLVKVMRNIREGQRGIGQQTKQLARLDYTVGAFERSMNAFNQRMDSLSQKLYNKDFRNALKAMEAMTEDAKRYASYEYLHTTDNDLEIMEQEYAAGLASCKQKGLVKRYIEAAQALLCETRLKKEEHEALQRLVTKMAHAESGALKEFVEGLARS